MAKSSPLRVVALSGLVLIGLLGVLPAVSQTSVGPNAPPAPPAKPQARTPPPESPAPMPPPSAAMQAEILSKMHQINQMEIRVGQLAQKKGSTFAIREYGDRLARDHKKGDAMVEAFAKEHKITLETPAMTGTPQEQMQKLESLSGLAFDGYFLELMESGHQMAVSMLGQAHLKLQGMPLGTLVGQLLPILEQHYIIAATLDIRMRAKGEAPQMSPAGGE